MLKRKNQVEARAVWEVISFIVAIVGIIVGIVIAAVQFNHDYQMEAKAAHRVKTEFEADGPGFNYYQGSVYKGNCWLVAWQSEGRLGTCYKLMWMRNGSGNGYDDKNMFVFRNNNQMSTPFLMDSNKRATRYDFKVDRRNNNDTYSLLVWDFGID